MTSQIYLVSRALLFCFFSLAHSQEVKTQPETLNVVCNCGSEKSVSPTFSYEDRQIGTPGKKGPPGNVGIQGPKGEKGSRGMKGQPGTDADETALINRILGMQSVTSCEELQSSYGVDRSGYFLMRSSTNSPIYNYCDFRVYQVSNCNQLSLRPNIIEAGYYKFGRSPAERSKFRFCQPVFKDVFTCSKLRIKYSVTDSGFYKFAAGNRPGFKVFCNFTSGEAVTEIWHDSMDEEPIPDCEDAGCYGRIPIYSISKENIALVVDNSRGCKQYIKSRCQGVLMNARTWWVSRAGTRMAYWGGATSRRKGYCACGETNTCVIKSKKCNCDNNSESVLTQDEGYLTDKATLPVKEMRFGDMGGVNELAWHTLGPLECTGQV